MARNPDREGVLVPLLDEARMTPANCGHKFARLARMRAAGLTVPAFFVLPVDWHRLVTRPLRPRIDALLRATDFTDPDSVRAAAARIRELYTAAPLPPDAERRVLAAFDQVIGPGAPAAVRACTAGVHGEDSAEDPFAGLSDSFLQVQRGSVADRVRACWASGYNAEALMYRHARGLPVHTGDTDGTDNADGADDADGIAVAVGVQRMVPAERSFVMFTCDPRTGAADTLIAAGLGLGEGVVQERVGVDHYFLRGPEQRVERVVAAKPERLVPDPERPDAGPVPRPVPPELRDAPVLDDARVRELAGLGRTVQRLFGGQPQDIEGAISADGRVHLVQSRPVAVDLRLRRLWSSANITESFPGPTTALTYSFAQKFYRSIFHDLYRRLGVPARTLHDNEPYLERMIGLHRNRIHYDLDSWYRLHGQLPVFPYFRASWESMMGLAEGSGPAAAPAPSPVRLARPMARVVRLIAGHSRAMTAFEGWWEALIAGRRGADWSAVDPLARIQDHREVWRQAGNHWGVTLVNDSVLGTTTGITARLLARWVPHEGPGLLSDLLCGEESHRSSEAVMSLLRLADAVRRDPRLSAALRADPDPGPELWAAVRDGAYGQDLRAAALDHLDRYGDRGLQELKMEQPNLRRTPWAVLKMAGEYAATDLDGPALRAAELRVRAAAEERLAAALGDRSPRLRLLRTLLSTVRRSIVHRENSRYFRSELFGYSKAVFASLGEDLHARGVLRAPGDVVHLTQDELFGWYDGSGVSGNLQALADARRAEYEAPGPDLPLGFTTLGPVRDRLPGDPDAAAASPPDRRGDGELSGLGSSSGVVRGTARVVLDPHRPVEPCEDMILVARETDPGWLFLMLGASGLVVERGTLLSHTAITGRKFGIPTVVAVAGATTAIPDGALIELDGSTGRVKVLAPHAPVAARDHGRGVER
ncbi:PEP/pyruvate-binding domain-containing protein [Streptomyces sp. NPDC001070]